MRGEFKISVTEYKKILKKVLSRRYQFVFVFVVIVLIYGLFSLIVGILDDENMLKGGIVCLTIAFVFGIGLYRIYVIQFNELDKLHVDTIRYEYEIQGNQVLVRNITKDVENILNGIAIKKLYVIDDYLVITEKVIFILPNNEDIRKALNIQL